MDSGQPGHRAGRSLFGKWERNDQQGVAATADRWQQVAQIYMAAVERDPPDRAAFLREACAGDEGLRREIESLLGWEGGADALLERPAAAVAAPMLDNSVSSAVLTGARSGRIRSARCSAPAAGLTQSPTITTPAMTQAGVILGTAAYMSPEQAKGREADKRSDIWAFGSVVDEMLTGRRAFDGDGMSETLATVIKSDPEWIALPADLAACGADDAADLSAERSSEADSGCDDGAIRVERARSRDAGCCPNGTSRELDSDARAVRASRHGARHDPGRWRRMDAEAGAGAARRRAILIRASRRTAIHEYGSPADRDIT